MKRLTKRQRIARAKTQAKRLKQWEKAQMIPRPGADKRKSLVRADDDMMIDLLNKLAAMKERAIAKQTALEQQRTEARKLTTRSRESA